MTPATAAPAAYLQIRDVVKDFGGGTLAVNHVDLDIAKGEIFALLGSSGCGKTTLLRMLAGFETPTSGRIVLDGQDLAGLPPYLRPINMMFQSYALFPHLTVWDNIAFGLKREGMARGEMAERVEAMLKLVQLGKYAKRKPHQLSGGQQQRVALARSLAKRPQLMLLDEPLGALDKKLREETQVELVNIIHEVGVTCVMVTHDQEEAMTMASRIAIMSEGKILQVGKPEEIYETPGSRFVADFIGNVNLMDGKVVVDEPDVVEIDSARNPIADHVVSSAVNAVTVTHDAALSPMQNLGTCASTSLLFSAVVAVTLLWSSRRTVPVSSGSMGAVVGASAGLAAAAALQLSCATNITHALTAHGLPLALATVLCTFVGRRALAP